MAKSFDISVLFKVLDRATAPLRAIGDKFSGLSDRLRKLKDRVRSLGKDMVHLGKTMLLRVSTPIVAFGLLALKSAADIETMTVAFEVMLGSGEKATKMVKDLVEFAARTPFELQGIGTAAKQLLGFGVEQKDLVSTLTMLGDVASGANMPLEDMSRIYGKIRAKGKLMAEELNQMSERGIPIIQMLADAFGVTQAAVYDAASESKISFSVVNEMLRRMTVRGGIYFDMMQKQSKTLAGLFSTLKDSVTAALARIGEVIIKAFDVKGVMVKLIIWIDKAVSWFESFSKAHPILTKIILIIAGIIAIAAPLLIVIGLIASGVAAIVAIIGPLGIGLAIAYMIAQIAVLSYFFFRSWGHIRDFFIGVWDRIVRTFNTAYNYIAKKINSILNIPGLKTILKILSYTTPVGLAARGVNALVGGEKKESKITVELKAAPGTEATIKKTEGDRKINVISESAAGAYGLGMY